jgi:hypothetical protein
MPRYDGPYRITSTDEKHSTVTLDLPNNPQAFPVFHTSEVYPFHENNNDLFPGRALNAPDPVTINGEEEHYINKIVDERTRFNTKSAGKAKGQKTTSGSPQASWKIAPPSTIGKHEDQDSQEWCYVISWALF